MNYGGTVLYPDCGGYIALIHMLWNSVHTHANEYMQNGRNLSKLCGFCRCQFIQVVIFGKTDWRVADRSTFFFGIFL